MSLGDAVVGLAKTGHVEVSAADVSALEASVGFRSATPIVEGVTSSARWYRQFYGF